MLLKWGGSGDEVKGHGVLELGQDTIFGHGREIAMALTGTAGAVLIARGLIDVL